VFFTAGYNEQVWYFLLNFECKKLNVNKLSKVTKQVLSSRLSKKLIYLNLIATIAYISYLTLQ